MLNIFTSTLRQGPRWKQLVFRETFRSRSTASRSSTHDPVTLRRSYHKGMRTVIAALAFASVLLAQRGGVGGHGSMGVSRGGVAGGGYRGPAVGSGYRGGFTGYRGGSISVNPGIGHPGYGVNHYPTYRPWGGGYRYYR